MLVGIRLVCTSRPRQDSATDSNVTRKRLGLEIAMWSRHFFWGRPIPGGSFDFGSMVRRANLVTNAKGTSSCEFKGKYVNKVQSRPLKSMRSLPESNLRCFIAPTAKAAVARDARRYSGHSPACCVNAANISPCHATAPQGSAVKNMACRGVARW